MRFGFGQNWLNYSQRALSAEQIEQGRRDFARLFVQVPLTGKSFLDIGFGQGLALCYASEAGAKAVGIDLDSDNLAASENTIQHFSLAQRPEIRIASILDEQDLAGLQNQGPFDVVHSWGVLHHTGDMARAVDHTTQLVAEDGFLVLAIYRRHWSSPAWRAVKWLYNLSPNWGKWLLIQIGYGLIYVAKWLVTGKNPKDKRRGMDFYYDVVDWVGGYPYEYASAAEVIEMLGRYGFSLLELHEADVPTGCNEFVFRRSDDPT